MTLERNAHEITEDRVKAASFYENIELYHNRVDKILKLISDYFDHRKSRCIKKYMAVRVTDGKITESTYELSQDVKDRIKYWLRNEKQEIDDSIYTIEFFDNIFFCKIFDFTENSAGNNVVLAGYVLEETALVRTFISKFSEKKIREKYERILAII
jgi:hypothetical protein